MIFGLETPNQLPDGWTPLEGVAIVKCLDEDGHEAFVIRATPALGDMECLGMLTAAHRQQLDEVSAGFEDEEGGD